MDDLIEFLPVGVIALPTVLLVLPGSAGGSVAEWKSTFKAAPGTDDATARTAIEGIYDAGLTNLQAKEAAK
jgi:hypothetical protein